MKMVGLNGFDIALDTKEIGEGFRAILRVPAVATTEERAAIAKGAQLWAAEMFENSDDLEFPLHWATAESGDVLVESTLFSPTSEQMNTLADWINKAWIRSQGSSATASP